MNSSTPTLEALCRNCDSKLQDSDEYCGVCGDEVNPDKIVLPEGSQVRLGRPLELVRDINVPEEGGVVIVADGPDILGDEEQRNPKRPSHLGVDEEEIRYVMHETDVDISKDVYFKDAGLCQTYGIFGVPGCGKTYALTFLLKALVEHQVADRRLKFGMMILDPKGALLSDVTKIMKEAGRSADLIVINEIYLRKREKNVGKAGFNVIDSYLRGPDLGKVLAMAAQSAGMKAKESFWINEFAEVFGAAADILHLAGLQPTLNRLTIMLLDKSEIQPGKTALDQRILDVKRRHSRPLSEDEQEVFRLAQVILQRFREPGENQQTLASFIGQAYNVFQRPEYDMFSIPPEHPKYDSQYAGLYDSIINDGKVVLVSVSRRSLALSKILCTLMKTFFQQTVLTRRVRWQSKELSEFKRPLLFLADEYSDVATEVEGHPMGDGLFFSQMRQFGCMGLVATQSVHMLQNSALGDTWKSIFANMTAKVFMQLGDVETAEEASKLVGESEVRVKTFDRTYNKDGVSQTERTELKDRKDLPTRAVLQTLARGQAVVVGATDGKSRPSTRFIMVNGRQEEKSHGNKPHEVG